MFFELVVATVPGQLSRFFVAALGPFFRKFTLLLTPGQIGIIVERAGNLINGDTVLWEAMGEHTADEQREMATSLCDSVQPMLNAYAAFGITLTTSDLADLFVLVGQRAQVVYPVTPAS